MIEQQEIRRPDAIDQHVGRALRVRRVEAGISQTQLGQALGITFQQIQKYENGTNRISASKIHKCAEMLGCSLVDFFPPASEATSIKPNLANIPGDARLAELYRSFSPRKRKLLLEMAEVLVEDGGSVA